MTARALLLLVFASAITTAVHAALEFSGYITLPDGVRFVVTNLEAQETSGWLKVGDAFQEHKIVDFDSKSETLTLDYHGTSVRLPLRDSHVKDARPTVVKKSEVHVSLSGDGNILIDGRVLSDEELRAAFRKLAAAGVPVDLSLHSPPEPNRASFLAAERVLELVRDSGIKRGAIHFVDSPKPSNR